MKKCTKCDREMKKPQDYCNEDVKSPVCTNCCSKVNEKELPDPSKGNLE